MTKGKASRFYIYKFCGKKDEVIYIGQTTLPKLRFQQHMATQPWWNEVKRINIAQCVNGVDMCIYEIYYINTFKPKYNISLVRDSKPTMTLPELDFTYLPCNRDEDGVIKGFVFNRINKKMNIPKKLKIKNIKLPREPVLKEGSFVAKFINLLQELLDNLHTSNNDNKYSKNWCREQIEYKNKGRFGVDILQHQLVLEFMLKNNITTNTRNIIIPKNTEEVSA